MRVLGTGVELRSAREDELRALERARRGGDFDLEPPRSFKYVDAGAPSADEVHVVAQAFVEFEDGPGVERCQL